MTEDLVQANNVDEAEKQVMKHYEAKSIRIDPMTREEYEALDKSEHEESDNHLNLERLGKDTLIADIAYYKFMENRETAFRIDLIDEKQKVKKQLYFKTLPRED